MGITTCGKTVYLNQLLTRLAMAMQNTGYYITENNLPDFKENVEANMPLPGSTDDSVMRRPLAVNLVDQNDRSKAFTIVFMILPVRTASSGTMITPSWATRTAGTAGPRRESPALLPGQTA